jgi:hypothetical protein
MGVGRVREREEDERVSLQGFSQNSKLILAEMLLFWYAHPAKKNGMRNIGE